MTSMRVCRTRKPGISAVPSRGSQCLCIGMLLILSPVLSHSQTSVNIQVYPTTIGVGHSTHVTVRAQSSAPINLAAPDMSAWHILSESRTQSETKHRSKVTYTSLVTYVLQAKGTGTVTIGPFRATSKKKVRSTAPVNVKVLSLKDMSRPDNVLTTQKTDVSQRPGSGEYPSIPQDDFLLRRQAPNFQAVFENVSPGVVGLAAGIVSDGAFRPQNTGSGLAWDGQDHVVTSAHLVADATEVRVRRKDGRVFRATILGHDTSTDVAVLRVPGLGLKATPHADTSSLKPGQWVAAIGNPYGMSHSITVGVVSAIGRRNLPKGAPRFADFIQSDVAIFRGNSGGPLVDTEGRVLGLNTAILDTGISFSARIEFVALVVKRLMEEGMFARGFAGLYLQPVSYAAASAAGLEHPTGARIRKVVAFGPGDDAGLQAGDIVIQFNENAIKGPGQLTWLIARTRPGTNVQLTILRGEERVPMTLVIESPPE